MIFHLHVLVLTLCRQLSHSVPFSKRYDAERAKQERDKQDPFHQSHRFSTEQRLRTQEKRVKFLLKRRITLEPKWLRSARYVTA
mmetsp:Transcript_8569/g.6520  ORF Transcript_8569/g.6520 Transcript_8569/m.6520 type:complete len:84 (-) Transcript_8569:35-286(-)